MPNRNTRQTAEKPDPLADDSARFVGDDPLTDDAAGITLPSAGGLSDLLCDKLLLLRPLGITQVESDHGTRNAALCYAVEVITDTDADKGWIDLGEVEIPWEHVMKELNKATPQAPWVLGTIVKRAKAYFLNPPPPRLAALASRTLRLFIEDRKAAREARES